MENYFEYELFFLDQGNSSSDPSQILIQQYPIPTTGHHKDWIYQTICQAKPIKFFIKLYTDHNTLLVKLPAYQKTESFRAASLSKLDNTVNNNAMLNSLENGRCSFISQHYIYHPYNLHQKFVPLFQSIFLSLHHPFLFTKLSLQSKLTLPFTIPQQFFHLPSFYRQPSQKSTPKTSSLPQTFIQFRLRQRTRELGSLVRTDTVLISSLFLKVWKMIAGLTYADSLSLRLRKLMY